MSRGLEPLEEDVTETENEQDTVDILLDETAYILADVIDLGRASGILQAGLGQDESLTAEKGR